MDQSDIDRQHQQAQVHEILKALDDPRATNRPVLQYQITEAQKMRNGGFPVHLYHETLDPVMAFTDQQKARLTALGYVEHYIVRRFPKAKYRRNTNPKFSALDVKGVTDPQKLHFVETIQVASPAVEKDLLSKPIPYGCSQWVDNPADLEPLPEGQEDPKTLIARLEGQLAEAQRAAGVKVQASDRFEDLDDDPDTLPGKNNKRK